MAQGIQPAATNTPEILCCRAKLPAGQDVGRNGKSAFGSGSCRGYRRACCRRRLKPVSLRRYRHLDAVKFAWQTIWQERRELGSTASAMSSMSISASLTAGRVSRTSLIHIDVTGGAGAGAAAFRGDVQPAVAQDLHHASSRPSTAFQRDDFHCLLQRSVGQSRWQKWIFTAHDTQFLLQARGRRRVLEAQLFVRRHDMERGLRHQRRFVEADRG
jgi:hypothetical protein